METEGQYSFKERFICEAEDDVEAIWKYMVWLCMRENMVMSDTFKCLTEYREYENAGPGWGMWAYKLDDSMKKYRDDNPWFYETYKLLAH